MIKALLFFLSLQLFAFAKPVVLVSILPQHTFVQKIAQDKVDIHLMVKPGSSPHSYEPKPSQMVALSKADLYFSIGVEFENVWLDRFKAQNPTLPFIDISEGIQKIAIGAHHHEEEHHAHHGHEEKQSLDPHTWTSPKNVKIMAQNIYNALAKLDPTNQTFYKKNLDLFLAEIKATDAQIRTLLQELPAQSTFLVFHPSWGYFAAEYDLNQVAVEVDGKSPKPKDIMRIIQEAKEENARVIFAQPEFSDKSAQIIAKESGIKVLKISPLNGQWSKNLITMAQALAK
ncbi:MAG: zinc ABC transporter substrate-binding protein [Helicobacteraceae bacterium]|nr:zinc ABC transporter substrate-binding protein [Helicobacteraceae bacterium]